MTETFSLKLPDVVADVRNGVHEFARDVIRPAAREWDEREEFPWPILQEAAQIDLYSYGFVEEAIKEPSGLTLPVITEELAWGDAGICLAILGSTLAAAGINAVGTQEQRDLWIPQCYGDANDVKVGAFAVTEPNAGSDVSNLRTGAKYDEAKDEWVINGTKVFITNGGIANVHVVVAAVDPELKSRGQASFIVPPGTKGLTWRKQKKLGIRASHTAELTFDNVRVPGHCLLGGKDALDAKLAKAREALNKPRVGTSGVQPAMATFEVTRPGVAAQAIGVARAAYEYALQYAKERPAFGKLIIEKQGIAFMLADMATEIDAARLMVHRAAWQAYHGGFKNAEGSMCKLMAGRVAVRTTERAVQIYGGYGYDREFPVERLYRDAKIYDIFEGTEQIQQLVIARAISGVRIE